MIAVDKRRLLEVLRLARRAAMSACEHGDYERGAKRGCGGCKAVVEIGQLLDELEREEKDRQRRLLTVMEVQDEMEEHKT